MAVKLVADTDDLERIAADDAADVRALHGWRHELFGKDALDLKHGRLALTAAGSGSSWCGWRARERRRRSEAARDDHILQIRYRP